MLRKIVYTSIFIMLGLLVFHAVAVKAWGANGICDPAPSQDYSYFPYGFICSGDPNDRTRVNLSSTGSVNSNSTISVSGGYNASAAPKRAGGAPATEVLVWVTIDGDEPLVSNTTISGESTVNGVTGNHIVGGTDNICPGTGTPYAPVYNYRDKSGSYGTAGGNGPDASPYAYVPPRDKGFEDCGEKGKMVYWTNATSSGAAMNNYKFDIKTNNGNAGQICLRLNVSVRFAASEPYFPSQATYGSASQQQDVVASHLAKQSSQKCTVVHAPPPPSVSGTCAALSFNTDTQYNGASTYTYVAISRIRNVSAPTPAGGNPTSPVPPPNPPFYTYRVLGDAKTHTISYIPIQQNLSINMVRHWHQGYASLTAAYKASIGNPTKAIYDGNATMWPTYPRAGDLVNSTIPCFSATCDISVSGDLPGGVVLSGGTLHVKISITNTGPQPLANPYPGPYDLGVVANGINRPLDSTFYPGLWPPGGAPQTGEIKFDIPNVTAGTSITAYPAYLGHFSLGGNCSGSGSAITLYTPFHLIPHASVCTTANCSEENPSGIDFNNFVECTQKCPVANVPNDNSAVFTAYGSGPSPPDATSNIAKTFQLGSPVSNNTLFGVFAGRAVNAGDKYCSRVTLTSFTDGLADDAGNVLAGSTSTDGIKIDASGHAYDEACLTVHNKPFFQVYNGGISAGGNFDTAGCTSTKGTLAGWADNISPSLGGIPRGAGSEHFALASKNITGFVSGEYKNLTVQPGTVKGGQVSFANTGIAGLNSNRESPITGGMFGSAHCIKTKPKPTTTTDIPTATINLNSLPTSGVYSHTGNLEITGGASLSRNIELYVSGDVYISANLSTLSSGNIGSWPSFTLHSGGNIYIKSTVSQINGVYSAEGNGTTTGKIFTCAELSGTNFVPVAQSSLYTTCNSRLNIYGSFVANQINLMRTFGSLRNASPGFSVCSTFPTSGALRPTCAAEQFRFTPEYFLAPSAGGTSSNWGKYDQITNLPPVL